MYVYMCTAVEIFPMHSLGGSTFLKKTTRPDFWRSLQRRWLVTRSIGLPGLLSPLSSGSSSEQNPYMGVFRGILGSTPNDFVLVMKA